MAKELPYFKFEPNQWDSGMVQLCSYQSKGIFIEMCCLYWSRLGDLPYALALQKLCNGDASLLQELESNQIYDVEGGNITINFLDEQLNEFLETSEKRRAAANERWKNASAMQMHSKSNAIREEKRRVDKRKEEKNIEDRKREFYNSLSPFISDFGKQTVDDFFGYWSEHGEKDKKFRKEKEKSFSIKRRLETWKRNEEKFGSKNQKPNPFKNMAF